MHSQEHINLGVPIDISTSGMSCKVASASPDSDSEMGSKPGNVGRAGGFNGPRHVVWEIAHECGEVIGRGATAIDPTHDMTDEILTTAESLSLIDELAGCGVVSLVFGGEPLAREDWRALVERAVERGLDVEIETSGTYITERTAAELATLGVSRVVVSIDSHLAEEHDALRGASGRHAGRYDHAVAAVRLLANCGAPVVVGFTATRRNWWDAAEVATLACALRAGEVRFVEYAAGACGSADLVLRADERIAARTTWRELAQQYRGYIKVSWRATEHGLVGGAHADSNADSSADSSADSHDHSLTPRIRPDGTLTPGVFSATSIGSFRRRSLRDMWTRSPLVAWLENQRRGAAAVIPDAPAAGSSTPRRRCRMVE